MADGATSRYRYVYVPKSHPLRGRSEAGLEHRLVLFDKIGLGPRLCHWCGCHVRWQLIARTAARPKDLLVADHVDGNTLNNAPENLVPACHSCNIWRSNANKVADDEIFRTNVRGERVRAVLRDCEYCRTEFRFVPGDKRPTVGRFCSRSCRARHFGELTKSGV